MEAATTPVPPVPVAPPATDPSAPAPNGSAAAPVAPTHASAAPVVPGSPAPGPSDQNRKYTDHWEPVPFWRAPFARSTWRAYGYQWPALGVMTAAFAYTLFVVVFTASTFWLVGALWLCGILVVAARGFGRTQRSLARNMLALDVVEPPPFRRPKGFWRTVRASMGDGSGWRAIIYGFISLPLVLFSFIVTTTFVVTSAGMATYWLWRRWLPEQLGTDGQMHRGSQWSDGYFIDTPPRIALFTVIGILMLWVAAAIVRGFARMYRGLTVAFFAPTGANLRVADLERSRGATLTEAEARLRRIERDLHDGTQARLVAVAMQLGEAKEQLASGVSDGALELVSSAHASTKEALVELRELVRGIRPPALDNGLEVALETFAARAGLPVRVQVAPGLEAADSIETIAYFCVTELVTNAVKHSRATGVEVSVRPAGEAMVLVVHDDGGGGAHFAAPVTGATGLAGLADRVRSVDGTLELDSPEGGPTTVTVTLPRRV